MNTILPYLVVLTSPVIAYWVTKRWIYISSKNDNLVSKDLHKPYEAYAARIGGLPITIESIILMAIIQILFGHWDTYLLVSSAFYSMIGFMDDVFGLKNLEKIVLSGIPFLFMASELSPFTPFDLMPFPLHLAAITLYGIYVTNAFNTLAGFNGLEAGLSSVISLTLSIMLLLTGKDVGSLQFLLLALISLAFLLLNWYPAKAFPGNVMTFFLGGTISFIAAENNLYWPLIMLTIPHGVDFFLKLISWGKTAEKIPTRVREDGTLLPPPNKSLAWLLIKKGINKERKLVTTILIIEVVLSAFTLIYFPS